MQNQRLYYFSPQLDEKLEKEYILATKKEKFGYLCLTSRKDFYQENYPQIAIEKGNIDDLIVMLGKGGRK